MDKPPLAVYIHWPYCARICPYCDFNVYKNAPDAALINAILDDLTVWREWSGPRHIISVHFGGGTPSLLSGRDIARLLKKIDQLWGLPKTAEIGLEMNPNNAAINKLDNFKAAGVNRLSLGLQSFNDKALQLLGRDHDGAGARQALKAGISRFSSVSADLIFGWSGQTEDLLQADLSALLDLGPAHISAYQLTIEAGTAFARAEARGDMRALDNDQSADFYGLVCRQLAAAGFEHYEVSNFAKTGHRSRHNLAYWQGHDYAGVGPGAHGRLTENEVRYACEAALRPDEYKAKLKNEGSALSVKDALSPLEWRDEYVLMGLRIAQGISLQRLEQIYPAADIMRRAALLIEGGLMDIKQDRLRVTPQGRPVLNYLTEKLLAG